MRALDRALAAALPAVPRPIVRRFADPYIAGDTLAEALGVVADLNRGGIRATLDVLGESITRADEAEATARGYREALDAIAARDLRCGISVKLSAIGLEIDHALADRQLEGIVAAAERVGRFVRIDMEDSRLTDATLDLYRRVREAGHGGVGVVLQAYLRRSVADVRALADLAPDVRLVKGIYVEPRRVAYQEMDLINRNFVTLVQEIVAVGGRVALATHDERVLRASLDVLEREGVARDGYEIQMLLGVQPALRERLVAEGHRMRVYVPFGAAWYAYSMRRLKENPSIAGYVARDALRSLVPGAR